eukprot:gene4617-5768_t
MSQQQQQQQQQTDIIVEEGLCIFEKDINNDVLLTWKFPSIDDTLRQVTLKRTNLLEDKSTSGSIQFSFSKFKNTWIYIYTLPVNQSEPTPEPLKKVVAFSVCIFRNQFNPEKYGTLAQIMANIYSKIGDPSKLLECQLRVMNRGMFDVGPLGKFVDADYDVRRSYLVTSIKDIIRLFGDDIILIWSAMIMKKRIVLYSEKLASLLKVIRALPLLVFHRQNWNLLRPYVTLSDIELKDLSSTGVYCAGFTDPSIKSREDLYDLFIDLSSKEVSVSSHSKDHFILGSLHKDILNYLNTAVEDDETTDQAVIKGIILKNKEIISKLESLKQVNEDDGKAYITLEILEARKMPLGMSNFLFSIANAEGLNGN